MEHGYARGAFTGVARAREEEDEKLRGSGEGFAAVRAREKCVFCGPKKN